MVDHEELIGRRGGAKALVIDVARLAEHLRGLAPRHCPTEAGLRAIRVQPRRLARLRGGARDLVQ
jgi:hypothetical protein